jgi:ADP-ribose pyrophosphatase YjhB (NUDIX family)
VNYIKYLRDRVGHDAINVTGVNVLVINSDNQVLLQRRGTFPFKWGLVGGITELGESLEDTAVRETREETGLEVRELILLGTTSGDNCLVEFPDGDKTYFISIGYYTKDYSGKLKIDNLETKELKFFDYDELPDNMPGSHKEMIDKYYKRD